MFSFSVLLRHLLCVQNRRQDWILFQYSCSKYSLIYENASSHHYNIMRHWLIFLKSNYFYFRYLTKIKLGEQGFSLFFIMVSHTFPRGMMDSEWEWSLLNDSSESGMMWCIPFVAPVCRHALRMLPKYSNRPRPKSLLFQDDPKNSVSEGTRTIWDSC